MLFSGIDLHKRSLVIHTLDAEAVTTREAELRSDRAAVMAYFATLAGRTARSSSASRAGTGCATCATCSPPPGLIRASRTPRM
jgi:hypothetical protein